MTEHTQSPLRPKQTQQSPEKKEKVISGTAQTKKKNGFNKLVNTFVAEEVTNVKEYIVNEVIIPTIRDTVWSVFTNSLDMFLYGGGKRKSTSNIGKVSYRNFYDERPSNASKNTRVVGGFNFDDVIFFSKDDASTVITQLREVIDMYGFAKVADLYEFSGLTPPHTSMNYGWTNLTNAEPERLFGGKWTIKLPRAIPIN